MTNEEALKVLGTVETIGEQVDALEIAIKALEKQIPKKPIEVDTDSGEGWYKCPTCGEMQTDSEGFTFEYPSCKCGQRLDWS